MSSCLLHSGKNCFSVSITIIEDTLKPAVPGMRDGKYVSRGNHLILALLLLPRDLRSMDLDRRMKLTHFIGSWEFLGGKCYDCSWSSV